MIIKEIAFGDFNTAFVEENLKNGLNIIYSNDNNKGKTLVIQGLMFALGNDPIFPSGFDYQNYYFYTMIEIDKKNYEFLRKNKTIIIKGVKLYQIFESLSELKYWINDNLFTLPRIQKKDEEKIVDLFLFYQLFFIGQDKRDSSNIQKNGYYNKVDFLSMLSYLNNSYQVIKDDIDIEEIRNDIKDKESKISYLSKQMKFVNNNPQIASHTFSTADKVEHDRYRKQINAISTNISNYKNQRSRETNRVIKLNNLLTELNSLNRNIEIGKVKCAECGSDKIIYTNGDVSFEITNPLVKSKIISSINEQIRMKNDIINELSNDIIREQEKQKTFIKSIPQDLRHILAFTEEILSDEEYNREIFILQNEISNLMEKLKSIDEQDELLKEKNNDMIKTILAMMNKYYREIDRHGNLIFDKLFTIKDESYSGSEEQEFYFCKLLSLNDYFKHEYPIIIDSFRSGELSTNKELLMLNIYKKLKKQVILTSTVKAEEYEKLKYSSDKEINSIDYSNHQDSKILSEKFKNKFINILKSFDINGE